MFAPQLTQVVEDINHQLALLWDRVGKLEAALEENSNADDKPKARRVSRKDAKSNNAA